MMEQVGILSNLWWSTVANDYSISIALVIGFVMTLLKIIAVIVPGNRTNSIVCLIQGMLYGFPGYKKTETSETKTSETASSISEAGKSLS
jgi:hypothetical protein